MDTSQPMLAPLRDVAGVLGSFAVDRAGTILATDLPPLLDTEMLREVGPRLLRLEETLASGGKGPDLIVLRFDQQRIVIRLLPNGALGVLATHTVNAVMLKMALTLTARRFDSTATGRSSAPPTVAPVASRADLPPDTRRSPVSNESVFRFDAAVESVAVGIRRNGG
ncbi:MAG TPA: roadblock/LC7 domain-containing protein [Polyangiaceae bacterium]|nr:roadblock/LC7 domain-containing protein [Polyangiaceae bacterium]